MSDAMSRKEVVEKFNEAMGDPKVPGYYTSALQEALRLLEQDDAMTLKPPSEMVEKWLRYCLENYAEISREGHGLETYIATQAAQWGMEQAARVCETDGARSDGITCAELIRDAAI